jgi:trigger factor
VTGGDERSITVAYPSDYRVEELAGRTVSFHVVVKDVREKRLPPVDDDFARTVGRFETLLDLRVKLRSALEAQAKAAGRRRLEEEIIGELVRRHQFELPESMVEARLAQICTRLSEGQGTREPRLDENEVRSAYRPVVEAQLRAGLILGAIAEKEGIEVSAEEVQVRVAAIAERSGKDPAKLAQDLSETEALSRIEDDIWLEKVHDFIVNASDVDTEFVDTTAGETDDTA